ncbi:hypothetical protein PoB_005727800 [Plakobranchus ocellatus]|uniref:Uncharacterized protein n=1 Tax=Plakobranchus ocellatus TaxID=259542 RepID=A0AAV4CFP7_9GAST|nr:hypothetical protein PoB_005727800 [Plakobranchus ocellatus]
MHVYTYIYTCKQSYARSKTGAGARGQISPRVVEYARLILTVIWHLMEIQLEDRVSSDEGKHYAFLIVDRCAQGRNREMTVAIAKLLLVGEKEDIIETPRYINLRTINNTGAKVGSAELFLALKAWRKRSRHLSELTGMSRVCRPHCPGQDPG